MGHGASFAAELWVFPCSSIGKELPLEVGFAHSDFIPAILHTADQATLGGLVLLPPMRKARKRRRESDSDSEAARLSSSASSAIVVTKSAQTSLQAFFANLAGQAPAPSTSRRKFGPFHGGRRPVPRQLSHGFHMTDICTDSIKETGPENLLDCFDWASDLIDRLGKIVGTEVLCERLAQWDWRVNTSFSGIGCPESAAISLQSAAKKFMKKHCFLGKQRPNIVFGICIEWNKACQTVLSKVKADHGGCGFTDINHLVVSKGADASVRTEGECFIHRKVCPLPGSTGKDVEIGGPPCIFWSKMGKGEGADAVEYRCHEAWHTMRLFRQEAIVIMENVASYDSKLLHESLGEMYDIKDVRFDPRNLGYPAARPRYYAVAVHKTKARWRTEKSLGDLLQPLCAQLRADASIFFYTDDDEAREHAHLTPFQQRHLASYQTSPTEAKIYDLGQNPAAGRGRTDLVDGSLPTLTTNSRSLWHTARCNALNLVGFCIEAPASVNLDRFHEMHTLSCMCRASRSGSVFCYQKKCWPASSFRSLTDSQRGLALRACPLSV